MRIDESIFSVLSMTQQVHQMLLPEHWLYDDFKESFGWSDSQLFEAAF